MNEILTLLPLITVFIIFYVILYIPQRRRQKKHKEYVENLKIGDNVITDSGIFGRVVNIKEEKVTLVVKKGEIEILKSNISYKLHEIFFESYIFTPTFRWIIYFCIYK